MGLLHDGRDRRRPDPPRVLALPRPRPSAVRAGPPVRATSSAATTSTSTTRSASCSSASTTTRAVLVVSDHGAQAMEGADLRQRVARAGGLPRAPRAAVERSRRSRELDVDWSRTRAWGEGGYYCRLFLNVKGREPQGVVPRIRVRAVRDELIERLEALPGPGGPIGTRVYRPEDLWHDAAASRPTWSSTSGTSRWRSNGSVGGRAGLHVRERHGAGRREPFAATGSASSSGPGIRTGRRTTSAFTTSRPRSSRLLDFPRSTGCVAGPRIPGDVRQVLDQVS